MEQAVWQERRRADPVALVGGSLAMQQLRQLIGRVAPLGATVLVTGPTGAGKEVVARALHAGSPRAARRFEAINCGAIPRELAEAELFGAEAGAFTGAARARPGRFELADGGTLFLDEIGELPLDLQVKLLRVLETRTVERLGGGRPTAVDVRIVAATNIDLEEAVANGSFRADLYWRLAVVPVEVAGLAERPDDVVALVMHFARGARASLTLTADAESLLRAHPWPGNVRELRNFVERALALGERHLDAAATRRLLAPRRRPVGEWLAAPPTAGPSRPAPLPAAFNELGRLRPTALKALLAEAEAALIVEALSASGGGIAGAGRLLGIKRTTLTEKMRRMGLKAAANEAA
jgi:DNA-binding NtrC family response regulator